MLLLLACTPSNLPVHHLAFGGDLIAGDRLNAVVLDPAARAAMLAQVAPRLQAADLALVNLEGTVSLGGAFVDKGEPRPTLYRARPELMDALAAGGIDLLAMANNHAGDYGADAMREALDRARIAGLEGVGAGYDAADARTPTYRVVGDTVVAFIGVDLTHVDAYAATADRPGTFAVAPKDAIKALMPVLAEARTHANVVFLTPHWGPNGATAPSEETRALGQALVRAGFDGILGHSAHVLQGVELVDGKPILYDAGNFLGGHRGTGDQADGLLYDVRFTRAGVTAVRAEPLAMVAGRVEPGRSEALAAWAERSRALGATPEGDTIVCSPGRILGPDGAPPTRPVPARVRLAPRDDLVAALPPEATPSEVRWANGMRMIGYRLVAQELPIPKAAQVFDLYFTADGPVAHDLEIVVRGTGDITDEDAHYPADWSRPGDEWPAGTILHDRVLLRLKGSPTGTVRFAVALRRAGAEIPVVESKLPQRDGVVLGLAVYKQGAKRIFALLGP